MTTDRYIKTVLTAIALLLGVIAFRTAPLVRADDSPAALIFDPDVRLIQAPGGDANGPGRLAIDLHTGNIYGFPCDQVGYPRDFNSDKLAISRPILLGRFDLHDLPSK